MVYACGPGQLANGKQIIQASLLDCKHSDVGCNATQVVKSTRQRWRKATADVPKVSNSLPGICHSIDPSDHCADQRAPTQLLSLAASPAVAQQRLRHKRVAAVQDPWGRLVWLWDRPPVKRVRLTISMAQWSVRLPALLALIATQARPAPSPPFAARAAACTCWHPHSSLVSGGSLNAFNATNWPIESANLQMSSFQNLPLQVCYSRRAELNLGRNMGASVVVKEVRLIH